MFTGSCQMVTSRRAAFLHSFPAGEFVGLMREAGCYRPEGAAFLAMVLISLGRLRSLRPRQGIH